MNKEWNFLKFLYQDGKCIFIYALKENYVIGKAGTKIYITFQKVKLYRKY